MTYKALAFTILLASSFGSITAQTSFSGKVINKNNQAISFVHVFFKNDQSKGSITNELGDFSIQVTEENSHDSLVFSVLGYRTLYVNYKDAPQFNHVFTLEQSSIMIDEVTIISDIYLRYLLKEAIAKIPENYPTEKHLQKAYYQHYTISDTTYAEMIETDVTMVTNGYDSKNIKSQLFLNQIRKSEDNRNLPDRLRSDNNKLFVTLKNNSITKRSFSRLPAIEGNSLDVFAESIDKIAELQVHDQYVDRGDTILTLRISDPVFGIHGFCFVSLNKTDLAIVKLVFGNPWTAKDNFDEVVYRKINGKYYPSYIRSVLEFEFDQQTKKHFASRALLFYDLITAQKKIKKMSKGKTMKPEKGLRLIKMKENIEFWNQYTIPRKVAATEVLRAKIK